MATVLKQQDNGWEQVLYMALELSNSKWKLAFSAAAILNANENHCYWQG